MRKERIEALADGIFAIAMTLLVLELHVPHLEANLSLAEVASITFSSLGSKLVSFAISFIVLGIYWGAHHMLMVKVRASNFTFQWLNILFLLTISFIPFSAAFLGSYPFTQFAQIFYASNLILAGITLFYIVHYAVLRYKLVDENDVSQEFRLNVTGKFMLPALSYTLAIGTSFFSTHLSIVFLVLGPAIYFIPIDSRLWSILSGSRWKLASKE